MGPSAVGGRQPVSYTSRASGSVWSRSWPHERRTVSASKARWSSTHGRIHAAHQAPKRSAIVAVSASASSSCSSADLHTSHGEASAGSRRRGGDGVTDGDQSKPTELPAIDDEQPTADLDAAGGRGDATVDVADRDAQPINPGGCQAQRPLFRCCSSTLPMFVKIHDAMSPIGRSDPRTDVAVAVAASEMPTPLAGDREGWKSLRNGAADRPSSQA